MSNFFDGYSVEEVKIFINTGSKLLDIHCHKLDAKFCGHMKIKIMAKMCHDTSGGIDSNEAFIGDVFFYELLDVGKFNFSAGEV